MTEQAAAGDPVTAAIAATVGSGIDEATAERIVRLARYLLDGDLALSMRLGPYKLDAPRAAVKAAVTAAALAIAIEGAGLDSVPVVVLACVIPFLVEIERVELTPGDDLVVAALRATALPRLAGRLPVRVKALAVSAGAPAVPGVDGVPVVIAVGGVAVAAESGVVVEPGLVNLGETERGAAASRRSGRPGRRRWGYRGCSRQRDRR